MTKKSSVLIALLGLCLCMACEKPTEKVTPKGVKFTVVKSGTGEKAKKGESIVFHYIIKDSKDSVWNDSYINGIPGILPIEDSSSLEQEIGIQHIGRMISPLDSATLTLPASKFFSEIFGANVPPGFDTTLTFTLTFRAKEIIESHKAPQYLDELFKKRVPLQKAKDIKKIDDFLASKGIKAEQDTSGLRYVLHSNKGGVKPTPESCVEVSYQGLFLENNQEFDSAPSAVFPLRQVVPGWTYGIPKLGVGDSATLYLPSGLAYGARGRGRIPPDAILVFNVKLIRVGNAFDQATGACQ
ncbi:FKBP-type peptidyl-prolyl cis-trans isomerase [Pseudochryseolinea flava]|nr:FKBP-type peptidyl-prolyl cis-trans isomerase [Pseudochryseolinea flava]